MYVDEKTRKSNAKITGAYMGVCLGIILAYVFGYAGRLMALGEYYNPISALFGVFGYLQEMKFGYIPIGINTYIGIGLGLLTGIIASFFWVNDAIRNHTTDMETSSGSGGFMSAKNFKEYSDKYIEKDPEPILDTEHYVVKDVLSDEMKRYSGNMIMTNRFCRPINSRMLIGNNNVLVVGGAGTGKSRFMIKPNLLQMNASYIVTDPSGEMINSVGKTLIEHGYKLKVFNISDMKYSNTYNPLRYIRDEAGVNMLITCLINNTTKGEGGAGDNQFFVDAEKLLYSACIFYLKDFCRDETKKNFAGVMDLINASQVDENNANAKSPLDRLFEELPKSSLAWKYYKAFKQAAGKTLKSIIISCVTRLQPFLTPQVRNLTSQDELDLEKIGDEKTALFIVTPQADRTYAFLASMLYSQLFETLYYKGEQQLAAGGSEQMKIPVRCMMDEFANIGEVPEFPSKLSTMRKYNISATIVLQDMAQLNVLYGEEEAKTLVGNCSSILFLGSKEINTLKYFSEMLDEKTIRVKNTNETMGSRGSSSKGFSYTGRKVMTPSELGEMSSDECIIFTQNYKPFRDKKYKYENHPYYPATADADPNNAFRYKELSIFDNSKNKGFRGIIMAKNAIAKKRKAEAVSELKKTDNPEIVANNVELKAETEKEFIDTLIKSCLIKAKRNEDEDIVVIKNTDMPTKYLYTIASKIADSVDVNEVIIFGGMESLSNMLIGVGYAKDGNKSHLRKLMNNELTVRLKESDIQPKCILNSIKSDDYGAYVEYVLQKKKELVDSDNM